MFVEKLRWDGGGVSEQDWGLGWGTDLRLGSRVTAGDHAAGGLPGEAEKTHMGQAPRRIQKTSAPVPAPLVALGEPQSLTTSL